MAGDAPDIMQIGDDAVPMFVDKNAFLPLDDFISGSMRSTPAFICPVCSSPVSTKASVAAAQRLLPMAVYYNKKIFDQFNIPYPTDDWTWDDLFEDRSGADKGYGWGR
jgi:multiple sugar transport system substrate-binding protein